MQRHGCKRFIFSSTCATYGNPVRVPVDETHPQDPVNPYGASKQMHERVLRDCATAWGLKSVFLRYFNASGCDLDGEIGEDHDPETHLIPRILMAVTGEIDAITVFGTDYPTPDGTCIRDYIHVEDLASAHLLALESLGNGRVLKCNLGNGQGYSVREVIEAARRITGHPIPVVEESRRAGDPAVLVASSALARQELGWAPQFPDLETIVRSAWVWRQAHPNGYGDR